MQELRAREGGDCPVGGGLEAHEFADEDAGVGVALEAGGWVGELGGVQEEGGDGGDAIGLHLS